MYTIPHSAPTVGEDEIAAAARVLRSGRLAQGREVAAFEEECAARCGRAHAVAVSSGTAALHLALEALYPAQDCRVALPSYGCAALMTAVRLAKCRPVLVDNRADFNLDPNSVAECDAVIVPHLFGAQAELPTGMTVIEDIAQCIGGPDGHKGIVSIASFYATKLITSGGEGGMLLTDNASLADAVRDRRDYDNRPDFQARYNYKMTDLQAAVGRVQLARLDGFIARRKAIASAYDAALSGLPVTLPSGRDHIYFRYVVRTSMRDTLETYLRERGIEAKRPVYCPAHHYVGGLFPEADRAHAEALSLPIYPTMSDDQVNTVANAILAFFE